jgi:hypothetical protein
MATIKTLIHDTTSAVNSDDIHIDGTTRPVQIIADGLVGSETVTLQYKTAKGNYYNFYQDDEVVALSTTRSSIFIVGKGIYRLVKSSTASVVSVEMVE